MTPFPSCRALHTYTFSNSLTGQKQEPEQPEQQEQKEASPPLPPPEEGQRPPLPPPDQTQTPPPPSGTPPPGYGDMEIEDEEPQTGMTDEMASFYSSLEPQEGDGITVCCHLCWYHRTTGPDQLETFEILTNEFGRILT